MRKAALLPLLLCALSLFAESFSFSAAKMEGSTAKGKERTILTGGAKVVSSGLVIEADRIELYGADYRYVSCAGKVVARDAEKGLLIKTEVLHYDREKKLSKSTGETLMEDRKNGIVIKGAYFENNDAAETTLIQVGVRILKDDMVCRSEYAFYRRKDKTLELSGLPVVYWKGDEYRASRIVINTETDEIKLEGKVSGSLSAGAKESAPAKDPAGAELPAGIAPTEATLPAVAPPPGGKVE